MADIKKTAVFSKKACDRKYKAAEAAGTDCSETCTMPCPYEDDEDAYPCRTCSVNPCIRHKCKALKIYRNRERLGL